MNEPSSATAQPRVTGLLPMRTGVLFPGTALALPVGREKSLALVDALRVGEVVAVVPQTDSSIADPTREDLQDIGTWARVQRIERGRNGVHTVLLEGIERFRLLRLRSVNPFWIAEGIAIEETNRAVEEARVRAEELRKLFAEVASGRSVPDADDPGKIADQLTAQLGLPSEKEYQVLAETDVLARLQLVTKFFSEARAVSDLRKKIESDVRRELGENQRQALLREQLRALQKELGEEGGGDDVLATLEKKLEEAKLPEEIQTVADRELRRLRGLQPAQAEYGVLRNYLEWIAELPWTHRANATLELDAVAKQLDADHAGLDDVKKRVLEHMAVLKLAENARGAVLCFAGPPGVGKTSLGQSIADAMGRPFLRIALGGVRDEAELRGHRRTYVGSLPGRIIHAMRKAKVKNPVVLLDEVDKLSEGYMGSPEAALLEVLDPEQNKTFTDHYLELPFDLSEVMFLCTVNNLDALSRPLRDRLEVIEIQGYTAEEKVAIARKHLVAKQARLHGIPEGALQLTDDALRAIIRDYTREAGVRGLTREIVKICRGVALEVARKADRKSEALVVDEALVQKYLGRPKFREEVAERTAAPGVATGLAWTPVGGDVLFIETTRMPGKGHVEITGQLGDVMRESARAALSYVRANATVLGVDPRFLDANDVHLHVPQGAVPKDGPSAGVTIFTAFTSLLTGRRVRPDTAMTGECTLRGRVLPVGGIKSKVLAAHRAGIKRVILPAQNARDIEDVPEAVRTELEVIFATDMSEVLAAALEPIPEVLSAKSTDDAKVGMAA